uniref:Phytanoyl-CoA dioxygenase n=1 Tax=Grammatophora oceanica TaxID=210454 RepID=A0A7S1Y5H0_9STRA|mmetsp:Transcript_27887/g.41109  ORF Transcript_27887/g.41109 Transcript_27887/m.41109 type:complete len:238 (+) Transcript_27887:1-714(+)
MLLQTRILDADQITELRTKVEFAISNVEALLSSRRPEIAYGKDNFHFREIASRGGERFDLRLLDADAKDFVRQHVFGNPRVTSFLSNALGSPNEIDFDTSVVYSRPGARTQGWHADGDHQRGATDAGWETDGWNARLANAYALCVFIPLIDLDDDVGFTQFWPASHRNRDLMGFGKVAELAQATYDGKCSAGDGIWYDYRLFHRGMPNSSTVVRPVLQVIFKKKWYVEKANYGVEPI